MLSCDSPSPRVQVIQAKLLHIRNHLPFRIPYSYTHTQSTHIPKHNRDHKLPNMPASAGPSFSVLSRSFCATPARLGGLVNPSAIHLGLGGRGGGQGRMQSRLHSFLVGSGVGVSASVDARLGSGTGTASRSGHGVRMGAQQRQMSATMGPSASVVTPSPIGLRYLSSSAPSRLPASSETQGYRFK